MHGLKHEFLRSMVASKKSKPHKEPWTKFRLPITGLALLGVVAFANISDGPRTVQRPFTIRSGKGAYVIAESEIEAVIRRGSKRIIITRNSNAITEVGRFLELPDPANHAGAFTINAASDTLSFVTPHPLYRVELDSLLKIFNPEIRASIVSVSKEGSLDKRRKLVEEIGKKRQINNRFKFYPQISEKFGQEEADNFLDALTTICIINQSIAARLNQSLDRLHFLDLILHESAHGAQKADQSDTNPRVANASPVCIASDNEESFAVFATIAYGETPWSTLAYLLSEISSYHGYLYIMKDYEKEMRTNPSYITNLSIDASPLPYDGATEMLEATRFSYTVFNTLLKQLGIADPLELLDKSDAEIQDAARAILNLQSISQYGKPFDQIVSLDDMRYLKGQAAAYYDQTYGKTK